METKNLDELNGRSEASPPSDVYTFPPGLGRKVVSRRMQVKESRVVTGQSGLSHLFRPQITLIYCVDPWVFRLWTLNHAAERVAVKDKIPDGPVVISSWVARVTAC